MTYPENSGIVTGGLKGIGQAITARLVESGAKVLVADSDPSINESKIPSKFPTNTVTSPTKMISVPRFKEHRMTLGLTFWSNNAGIFPTTGPIEHVTDEFVSRMLEVNVRAQYSASREAANYLRKGGAIVNIASIAALRGGANISAYSTSKAAIVGLTQSFAQELGRKRNKSQCNSSGMLTPMKVQEQLQPLKEGGLDIESAITANPLRLIGDPDYIARSALFLISDLSAFVTGHILVVDGGSTA